MSQQTPSAEYNGHRVPEQAGRERAQNPSAERSETAKSSLLESNERCTAVLFHKDQSIPDDLVSSIPLSERELS